VIIADATRSGDVRTPLAVLRPFLASHGRAFVAASQSDATRSWQSFFNVLRATEWRVMDALSIVGPDALVQKNRRQYSSSRRSLWPLRFASSWIVEARACDPTKRYALHLMPTFGVGGTERLVLDLTAHLRDEGFETSVIGILGGGELEAAFREHDVPIQTFHRRDPFGISTLCDVYRACRFERPDIVHTHLFGADAWGRLAAWFAGVRTIISTEHNVNPSYGFIKHLVNRVFAKFTAAIVAVSASVRDVSIARDGIPRSKIHIIPNGIDMDRVIARGGHGFHDVPRLITVGRLYPQKDHATLLKALALVKRPWRLSIIGDGPLASDLRALADRLGIAARIEWMGIRSDVPERLVASDVFCFPSRWEGLGNAVIEAVAAGVPAIVSDLPPLHDVLAPSDVTFVEPGNVPAWVHAIAVMLDDAASAVMRAARAMPRIRATAALPRMVKAYADLYRECIARL